MSIEAKAARIRLVLFDIDGVLTDGRVQIDSDGTESKSFGIRDGIAIVWAQRAGLKVGFLSARHSPTTVHRAAQLGVSLVYQGVSSKVDAYDGILTAENVRDRDVAYMGDDVVDLGVLARVGLSAAPADAVSEVKAAVDWVSDAPGGAGAARQLIEIVLRAQQRWDAIVAAYAGETAAGTGGTRQP
jgi:3-deoxy-D-manno-octulosonate 8-phosphate phosphatase (KDO 8-P phosphatase)